MNLVHLRITIKPETRGNRKCNSETTEFSIWCRKPRNVYNRSQKNIYRKRGDLMASMRGNNLMKG
jgi:hypothetical protein